VILVAEPAWRAAGELTIWMAAVAVAIGALSRTTPLRWVFSRLVAEPFTAWFRETGGEIIEEKVGKEFSSNGGASLRDAIDTLSAGQDTLTEWATEAAAGQTEMSDSVKRTGDQVEEVKSAVVAISASIGTTLADHGQRITLVEKGHADVLEAIDRLHRCMERRLSDGAHQPVGEQANDLKEEA
jgi:methyl-accepting chemotaxis protein